MEIKGQIAEIRPAEKKGENFVVRTFILEVLNTRDPKYNDYIEFQTTGDRCAELDKFMQGAHVVVTFDIRGRKWVSPKDGATHYITTLNAWKIAAPTYASAPPQQYAAAGPQYGMQAVKDYGPTQAMQGLTPGQTAGNNEELPF